MELGLGVHLLGVAEVALMLGELEQLLLGLLDVVGRSLEQDGVRGLGRRKGDDYVAALAAYLAYDGAALADERRVKLVRNVNSVLLDVDELLDLVLEQLARLEHVLALAGDRDGRVGVLVVRCGHVDARLGLVAYAAYEGALFADEYAMELLEYVQLLLVAVLLHLLAQLLQVLEALLDLELVAANRHHVALLLLARYADLDVVELGAYLVEVLAVAADERRVVAALDDDVLGALVLHALEHLDKVLLGALYRLGRALDAHHVGDAGRLRRPNDHAVLLVDARNGVVLLVDVGVVCVVVGVAVHDELGVEFGLAGDLLADHDLLEAGGDVLQALLALLDLVGRTVEHDLVVGLELDVRVRIVGRDLGDVGALLANHVPVQPRGHVDAHRDHRVGLGAHLRERRTHLALLAVQVDRLRLGVALGYLHVDVVLLEDLLDVGAVLADDELVLALGDLQRDLGHLELGLVVVDAAQLGTRELHLLALAAHHHFVALHIDGRYVDLGAGARGDLVHGLVVEAAQPRMVELGYVEAFEGALGLLVDEQLNFVYGELDAVLGSGDADQIGGRVGLGHLDLGARLLLELLEHRAVLAHQELVLLLGHAYLRVAFGLQLVDDRALRLDHLVLEARDDDVQALVLRAAHLDLDAQPVGDLLALLVGLVAEAVGHVLVAPLLHRHVEHLCGVALAYAEARLGRCLPRRAREHVHGSGGHGQRGKDRVVVVGVRLGVGGRLARRRVRELVLAQCRVARVRLIVARHWESVMVFHLYAHCCLCL